MNRKLFVCLISALLAQASLVEASSIGPAPPPSTPIITSIGNSIMQFSGTADATVNGAGETTIVPTGAGSMTLPVNFWAAAGSKLHIVVYGTMNTNATPGTVTWNVKLDGVTRMGGGAQNLTTAGSGNKYYLDIVGTARTVGVGGSINYEGWGQYINTSPTAGQIYTMQQDASATDTTVTHTLDVTINFSQNTTSQFVTKSFYVMQI